jgi:hypothetical protein
MGFFETSDGFAHVGRIAGVFYLLALVPGCEFFHRVDALCAMRIVSTVGWWLAFRGWKTENVEAIGPCCWSGQRVGSPDADDRCGWAVLLCGDPIIGGAVGCRPTLRLESSGDTRRDAAK